jgi:redox-sensitive bicupin YhaK (pirin superfamily)
VASPDGADGSVTIHADARLYAGLFDGAESAQLALPAGRKGYVHLVRGALHRQRPAPGGRRCRCCRTNETVLTLADGQDAEVLVFDLAA